MERTRNDYQPPFLNIHQLARRYGIQPSTVYLWMKRGVLPQPIRLTPGCSRWALSDLEKWEDQKRAERCPRHQWEEDENMRRQQRSTAEQ